MPESSRVRHVQQHARPLGGQLRQPSAYLGPRPRPAKRAKQIAERNHKLRAQPAGSVDRPSGDERLVNASCSGCRWTRTRLPREAAQDHHVEHLAWVTEQLQRKPRRNPRTQAL